MTDHIHEHQSPDASAPASISRLIRILRAYLPLIGLAMAAVATGYLIVALALYLMAPSSRVTSMAFRLEFDGADRGEYPNGTKFSPTEIISTPVLLKTFNANNLGRFTTFSDFSTSVFVLQSNAAQEALAREYQARLSDMRLSAVDRERIQRDYEMKLASLSKDQYAIFYVRKGGGRDAVPEVIVRKVVHDILRNWAHFAANEQHVLQYRVAVLSADVVADGGGTNPIVDIVMMRDKVHRLLFNIEQIRALPAAELAQTSGNLTLTDLAVRLDDIVRYRLDPLVNRIAAAGLDTRSETIRFLETQLAHDERRLESQKRRAEAAQQTLALYMNAQQADSRTEAVVATAPASPRPTPDSETVMPQISETFLDRIIQLTSRSVDTDFRKRLAEEYRTESLKVVPFQEAVTYDRDVLALVRSSSGSSTAIDPQTVPAAIASLRVDLRALATQVREIHKAVSMNLNPATELVTASAPSSSVARATSLKNLVMYGLLTLALALPVIILICLLHNHVRQEREEEERLAEAS